VDEVIQRFNANRIRYLLIGGQAVRLEGLPRFSLDWDFYIPPHDRWNVGRINALLREDLDVPLVPLGRKGENFIQTYQTRWGVLQFHLGGPGLPEFDEAEKRAVTHQTEAGTDVRCLSGLDLLESKRRANRPEDQSDIRFLENKLAAGRLQATRSPPSPSP
jgi:hypothetical protein